MDKIITRVHIKSLKEGDEIYIPSTINTLWWNPRAFKYCQYRKEVVKRITPKGTKLVTMSGKSLRDKDFIYLPCEEIERRNHIVNEYVFILKFCHSLEAELHKREFSDEEIVKMANMFREVRTILESDKNE